MFSEASDRTRFSNFFRTIPSDGGFGPAIVSLLQLFNWERIAVFTQRDGVFNEVAAHTYTIYTVMCYLFWIIKNIVMYNCSLLIICMVYQLCTLLFVGMATF